MFPFINLVSLIVMSFILTACGGGGGSSSAVVNGSTYTMTAMTLSPASINGTSASTNISVQIRQQSNGIISAYSGANVRFTSTCITQGKATLGTVLAANGTYTATYTNNGCSGTDTIVANASIDSANLNPIEQTLTITGVVQTIADLTITAANTNVPADGTTQTAISVFVSSTASSSNTTNTTGTPATGVTVNFATNKGSLSATSAITDSQGYASVYLISSTQAGQATVTASANGFLRSTSVSMGSLVPPARLIVSSGDAVRPNTAVTINALALDSYGQPVANANLIFEVTTNLSGGHLTAYAATTNAQGQATITYTTGNTPSDYYDQQGRLVFGYDIITVNTSNAVSQTSNIRVTNTVVANDINPANMTLTTGNGTTDVPANNTTEVLVSAAISNLANNPLQGTTVNFATTLGSISATGITDANGVVRAFIRSGTAGTATITASTMGIVRAASINFTPSTNGGGTGGTSAVQIGIYNGSSYTAGTIQAPTSITANSSSAIQFNLFNANTTPNTAYTIDASTNISLISNCVLMGKASISAATNLGNGVYTATYTDGGCNLASDTITATALINYQTSRATATFSITPTSTNSLIELGYHDGVQFYRGNLFATNSTIAANSSTQIRMNLQNASTDLPYTTDASGSFSIIAQCQLAGKADVSNVTHLGNGVYQFSYTDQGCTLTSTQNIITANATVNGQSTNSAIANIGISGSGTLPQNIQMGSCTNNAACTTNSFTVSALKSDVAILSAGGQTNISGVLWDSANGAYHSALTSVSFTSVCAQAGKATINNTTANNGQFSAVYKDLGCASTDIISASASVNSNNLSATTGLNVSGDSAGSIQFVSATPTVLAIKGSGTPSVPEQSTVTFKVIGGSTGTPVNNASVTFSLSTTTGGITISPTTATTNSNGEVTVIVSSGTTPTPVRVIATAGGVSTQSSALTISTTLADQPHFSMAAETPNPSGAWDIQGQNTTVTVLLADQFSNPPPIGTVINFRAESGQITPSCTTDIDGKCAVTWTSQTGNNNPPLAYYTSTQQDCYDLPTNLSNTNNKDQGCVNKAGRVTIMAWSLGSEGFIDLNNNGTFDGSETFAVAGLNHSIPPSSISDFFYYDRRDLEPPFLDANYNFAKETGVTAGVPNEYEVPNAQPNAGDYTGKFNGPLCETGNLNCSTIKSIYIFRNMEIVMPTRNSNVTFWNASGTTTPANITAAGNYNALIQDTNGNTMGDGTSIAIAASTNAVNLTVTATPPTIDKQAGYGQAVGFSVSRSDPLQAATGSVEVTVTSGGIITTRSIAVSI